MTTMCIVQLFRNPCNLKATDLTFFIVMYTPVAVEERLTLIQHPNAFMN